MTKDDVLDNMILDLRSDIAKVAQDAHMLRDEAAPDDELTRLILHKLLISLQNAYGCATLAEARLAVPIATLARSMFEFLIAAYWSTLSAANARVAVDAERNESVRLMRNNLRAGRGAVVDKSSGKDETAKILNNNRVTAAKRPPSLSEMADKSQMKNVYDMLYGFLSMFAHGTAAELIVKTNDDGQEILLATVPLARTCLNGLHLVAINRIRQRRVTQRSELEEILNVRLYS
jgi:hypothetical protein